MTASEDGGGESHGANRDAVSRPLAYFPGAVKADHLCAWRKRSLNFEHRTERGKSMNGALKREVWKVEGWKVEGLKVGRFEGWKVVAWEENSGLPPFLKGGSLSTLRTLRAMFS
jgi:hypothetical protein